MNFLNRAAGYFVFEGRLSRSAFLLFYFLPASLLACASGLDFFLPVVTGGGVLLGPDGNVCGSFASVFHASDLMRLMALLLFVPGSVRRLHDAGQSGWVLLLALLPIVRYLVVLYILICPGEYGKTRYGFPPGRFELAPPESVQGPAARVPGLWRIFPNLAICALFLVLLFYAVFSVLRCGFGGVVLRTFPEGAEVYCGDSLLGESPLRLGRGFFEGWRADPKSLPAGISAVSGKDGGFVVGDVPRADGANMLRFKFPKSLPSSSAKAEWEPLRGFAFDAGRSELVAILRPNMGESVLPAGRAEFLEKSREAFEEIQMSPRVRERLEYEYGEVLAPHLEEAELGGVKMAAVFVGGLVPAENPAFIIGGKTGRLFLFDETGPGGAVPLPASFHTDAELLKTVEAFKAGEFKKFKEEKVFAVCDGLVVMLVFYDENGAETEREYNLFYEFAGLEKILLKVKDLAGKK